LSTKMRHVFEKTNPYDIPYTNNLQTISNQITTTCRPSGSLVGPCGTHPRSDLEGTYDNSRHTVGIHGHLGFIKPEGFSNTGNTYIFMLFTRLQIPGTSPIRFVSKIRAILTYLCVRSSVVYFEGTIYIFGGSLASPLGRIHFRKTCPKDTRSIIFGFNDFHIF